MLLRIKVCCSNRWKHHLKLRIRFVVSNEFWPQLLLVFGYFLSWTKNQKLLPPPLKHHNLGSIYTNPIPLKYTHRFSLEQKQVKYSIISFFIKWISDCKVVSIFKNVNDMVQIYIINYGNKEDNDGSRDVSNIMLQLVEDWRRYQDVYTITRFYDY